MSVSPQVNTEKPQDFFNQAARKTFVVAPFNIMVPIVFWFVFMYSGIDMNWKGFGIGIAGWMIALMLRGPIGLLVKKLPKKRAQNIVIGSSGPLEEGVRLGALLLTGMSFPWALSIGQGWAAIEVLFTVINAVVVASLLTRTDEKAQQAKEILQSMGRLDGSPLWGIVERVFATAFHIGATLLIARYPILVLVMIFLHSSLNLLGFKLSQKSIVKTELFIAIMGSVVFLTGILLF